MNHSKTIFLSFFTLILMSSFELRSTLNPIFKVVKKTRWILRQIKGGLDGFLEKTQG